jgi:hypothetical protein
MGQQEDIPFMMAKSKTFSLTKTPTEHPKKIMMASKTPKPNTSQSQCRLRVRAKVRQWFAEFVCVKKKETTLLSFLVNALEVWVKFTRSV